MQSKTDYFFIFGVFRLQDDFSGAATQPFSREITQVLMSPVNEADIEIKPDGTIYQVLHSVFYLQRE